MRILGHADVVAPAAHRCKPVPALSSSLGLIEFERVGRQLIGGVGRREVAGRRRRPGPARHGGCRCRPSDAAHVVVLAVLGNEEVLPQRRTDGGADIGRIELADPDTIRGRGIASRRARTGRHEGQQVVLPDRIGRPAVDRVGDRVRVPAGSGAGGVEELIDDPVGRQVAVAFDGEFVFAVPVRLKYSTSVRTGTTSSSMTTCWSGCSWPGIGPRLAARSSSRRWRTRRAEVGVRVQPVGPVDDGDVGLSNVTATRTIRPRSC